MVNNRSPKNNRYQVEQKAKTKALVIAPKFTEAYYKSQQNTSAGKAQVISNQTSTSRTSEARLEEAVGLAKAIDLEIISDQLISIKQIKPSTFFGPGKVEELSEFIKIQNIELCIVDHALTPVQQRNLEQTLKVKVLDRTGLILEIFGKRANTKEGRLQVELAHLEYQRSRLVRSWTHLERQRGGFGFLGGPGETQIEADRRQLQGRIEAIRKDLEGVKKTRQLHRKGRKRVPFPVVALVGYTNAGKSTLFNKLTGAEVFAQDLLFATLDPTMREILLPSGMKVILSDTVGFISDLPTHLIAAFRATLEEVLEADIILHVRDISHQDSQAQEEDVNQILKDLGVDHEDAEANIIYVWNKVDVLDQEMLEHTTYNAQRSNTPVAMISATTGTGMDSLLEKIEDTLQSQHQVKSITLEPSQGVLMNWLYENTEILDRKHLECGAINFEVRLSAENSARLEKN